jgi:hypothetical protein
MLGSSGDLGTFVIQLIVSFPVLIFAGINLILHTNISSNLLGFNNKDV